MSDKMSTYVTLYKLRLGTECKWNYICIVLKSKIFLFYDK